MKQAVYLLPKRINRKIIWMGMPFVVCFLGLYIFPFLMTCAYSFLDNTFSKQFVGLENYISVMHNVYFMEGFTNTIHLTLLLTGSATLLAIFMSYFVSMDEKISAWFILCLILPFLFPSVAIAKVFYALFDVSEFMPNSKAYFTIISFYLFKYLGIGLLLILVGFLKVPREVKEAAMLDGAGHTVAFLRVLLPLSKDMIYLMVMLFFMYAFRIYKESYILFSMYPPIPLYLVQHYMNNHFLKLNFQNVAVSAVLFALLQAVTFLLCAVLKKEEK